MVRRYHADGAADRLPPVVHLLAAKKIKLIRSAVGEFITTQEAAGFFKC